MRGVITPNQSHTEILVTRTALDLSPREWQAYRPGGPAAAQQTPQTMRAVRRRQQAWRVAQQAARLLRDEYGASKVVVFGSLVHDTWFTP